MLQINDQHGCTFSVMFAPQLARDKDLSFLTKPIILWAEGIIYIGTSRGKKKKKSLNMLHFVSLTFFMQHLFAFLFFQEMTQLPVCFGGPRECFRPLFSLDLAECSILQESGMGCALQCAHIGRGTMEIRFIDFRKRRKRTVYS